MDREIRLGWQFWIGICILAILGVSYFIQIEIERGANYISTTPLLGILILYNPFILALYVLASITFIARGILKRDKSKKLLRNAKTFKLINS